MIRSEVVDDWIAGVKEVPLKSIASKCTVIERKATDDSSTIFKAHKETRENHDVYICRYRLVKQSSYVLLPIKWIACDAIEQRRTEVKKGQKNGIIYADEQITYESDDPLADHHFEAATTQLANMQLQVSPLKILNQNSVQKIKRPAQQESAVKERTVNEDDDSKGSPNKRKTKRTECAGLTGDNWHYTVSASSEHSKEFERQLFGGRQCHKQRRCL